MRKVHTLGISLMGVLVVVACGSSSSDSPPGSNVDAGGTDSASGQNANNGTDAGDASVTSENDSGIPTTGDDGATACVIDADILTLSPSDAALDDAGDSVGTCLACAQTTCGTSLTTCNGDCTCNTSFACLAECLGGVGNTLLTCVSQCFPGGFSGIENNPAEAAVVSCVAKSCNTQCAVGDLLGGGGGTKDAGPKDAGSKDAGDDAGAGDASTDSAVDGDAH